MGTSSSSSGPSSEVPFIPEWVRGPDAPESEGDQDSTSPGPTAPPARFRNARTEFGKFAKSGDKESLRRGLAHYVVTGLGGSQNATRRMGGAAYGAGKLFDTLEGLSSGTSDPEELGLTTDNISTLPPKEIIDRIAEFVSPSDGTQDTDSSRRAIHRALSDLLDNDPMLDIGSLTKQQIEEVLERCTAYEIAQRIELDIGKAILEKSPNHVVVSERNRDIEEYIRVVVAEKFKSRQQEINFNDASVVEKIINDVIKDVFIVFEIQAE